MAMSKWMIFYMPVFFDKVLKFYRFYSTNSDWWVWGLGFSFQRMACVLGKAKTFHFSTWDKVRR